MNRYIILFYCYLDNIIDKKCIERNKYNFEKIYGQFFINLYNNRNNEKKDFKLFLESFRKYCNQKINEKYNLTDYILDKIMVKIITENNKKVYNYTINYSYKNEQKIATLTVHVLKSNIIYKSNKSISKILLIYKILGLNSGLFWGLDPKIYNIFINNKSAIECFASPFNHTLKNYYSLLDIDKDFGSKGNFFDNFITSKYDVYMMNPPFTADLILKVFDQIKNKLQVDNRSYCIYLYIPKWDDINIPFYDECAKKYKIFKHDLLSRKSYVYDYIKEKNMVATFDTTIFLITNEYKDEYYDNFKKIIKIMQI